MKLPSGVSGVFSFFSTILDNVRLITISYQFCYMIKQPRVVAVTSKHLQTILIHYLVSRYT